MPDANQISKDFRDRLRIADPELSTALGTPVRKILDAVADSLSELSFDNYFDKYKFDLESYSGTDLDEFVGLFGFQRQRATAARASVTIERDNADRVVTITPNSQFYRPSSSSSAAVYFVSVGFVVMDVGVVSAEVPVRAVVVGTSGNVQARSITQFESGINAVRVYNLLPATGGMDDESDEQLRSRFRATVFRNVAGTKDQYLGVALAHALVNRANLVGQVSFWSEIVTMTDMGDSEPEASSTNTELSVLVDDTYGVWLYDIEGVDHDSSPSFYTQGADFDVSESGGVVTFKQSSTPAVPITDGAICRMEYEYLSVVNRNNAEGVHPRAVELIIDGEDSILVVAEVVLNTSNLFTNDGGSMDVSGWVRIDDETQPSVGNVFLPLPYQPVLGVPDSIEFGAGVSVVEGDGYFFVRDATSWRGSPRGRDGVEFVVGASPPDGIDGVSDGTVFTVQFQYNRVPQAIQDLIERHRQVPADALVHSGKRRYLSPHVFVMYSTFPTSIVDSGIEDAVEEFFDSLPFGSWVQLSDIEKVIHGVSGVDSVRLLNDGDGYGLYGVVEYASDGVTVLSQHTNDIKMRSDEVPVLYSVTVINRTQEQWV